MYLSTIYLQKEGSRDDIIRIARSETDTMFTLEYAPGDLDTKYTTLMDRSRVSRYVRDLLVSLTMDTSPFDNIQVSTKIYPSIVYNISDLNDLDLCSVVEDSILSVLDVPVRRS